MTVNIPRGRAGPATTPGSTGSPAPPGPPGEACDADLIQRSEAEPEQFAALFRRHSGALHRYVARRLGTENGPVYALQTNLVTTSPQCTGS